MPDPRNVLTPDALTMMDAIARSGSFAAAARELGKVPSALTYNVRQLEDALDVLLFDRRSRQATLTAAGQELLDEGRRLLEQMDAVANRVKRVATGWETQLSDRRRRRDLALDDARALRRLLRADTRRRAARATPRRARGAGARHRRRACALRTEVLAGTWEALVTGQADLAIGVGTDRELPSGVAIKELGPMSFVFAVAPHHPLAAVDRADRRRRAGPPSRRRGRRLGASPDADHGQPAAGPGRAHGERHAGQDRGAAARPGLRLRARADGARAHRRRAAAWSRRAARARSAARWATPGGRDRRRARARARRRSGWRCAGGSSGSRAPTTRRALLERHGSAQRRLRRERQQSDGQQR